MKVDLVFFLLGVELLIALQEVLKVGLIELLFSFFSCGVLKQDQTVEHNHLTKLEQCFDIMDAIVFVVLFL
jgi:hypothetical protein